MATRSLLRSSPSFFKGGNLRKKQRAVATETATPTGIQSTVGAVVPAAIPDIQTHCCNANAIT